MKDQSGFPVESVTQPSAADPIIEAARHLPTEPPRDRRERDKYDSNRFADDLEAALGVVRQRVLEARRTSAAQPHLPEGIQMQEATLDLTTEEERLIRGAGIL